MTIEDENIDHMVKLIRYEPLENFFSRHPSLEEYKDLLRSSQSDNTHGTRQNITRFLPAIRVHQCGRKRRDMSRKRKPKGKWER